MLSELSSDEVQNCDTRVLFTIPYSGPPTSRDSCIATTKKSHHLCMACYLDQAG